MPRLAYATRTQYILRSKTNGAEHELEAEMPFLMIDLDDPADCRRGMHQLRRMLEREGGENDGPRRGPRGRGGPGRHHRHDEQACDDKTPLKDKLQRIKKRGVWRFLSQIAALDDSPRSLAEFDAELELPRNKMRSTKAIFAKLENRLGIQFLVPAKDGQEDDEGNPRYIMPLRIRKAIRKLTD